MKKAFVAAAAVLLLAGASFAALVVEVDLDGVVGDGPDYIVVPVSTYVPADIWIVGDAGGAWVAGLVLCNPDHSLEYQSCVYNSPGGGWAFVAPQPPDPQGCITVQGQNFSFDVPMVFPWKIATVTYHAAVDHTIDDLFLMGPEGGVLTDGGTVFFDNLDTVVGQIQIGIIDSVEETNWGAVKNLFR